MSQTTARLQLDAKQQEDWNASLIEDERRHRPLYFNGRFLTARDMIREQNYFLTRQADLGQAGGGGVTRGLHVTTSSEGGSHISISPGHGVTSQGEVCFIGHSLTIDLADTAVMQQLNSSFGMLDVPRGPSRNLSGLFLLALRPVEFSATPITAYPTNVNGTRKQHDGEIVEGVVVTLILHSTDSVAGDLHRQRAALAREIFGKGSDAVAPASTLPLAMVAIDQNQVVWVDTFLARRELGTERSDLLGLGLSSRASMEASIQQYNQQVNQLVLEQPGPIMASSYFSMLPPVGRMPRASVATDFTQVFFPQEIEVDLTLVPEDELPQLIEESLSLPAIDLSAEAEQLRSTSVTVFAAVARDDFRTQVDQLPSLSRELKPATVGMMSIRTPLEQLSDLKPPKGFTTSSFPVNGNALPDAAWRNLLDQAKTLWYARRHNVPWEVSVVSTKDPRTGNGGNNNDGNNNDGNNNDGNNNDGNNNGGNNNGGNNNGGNNNGGNNNGGNNNGGNNNGGNNNGGNNNGGNNNGGNNNGGNTSSRGPTADKPLFDMDAAPENELVIGVVQEFSDALDQKLVDEDLVDRVTKLISDEDSKLSPEAARLLVQTLASGNFLLVPSLLVEAISQVFELGKTLVTKSEMDEFLEKHRYSSREFGKGLARVQATSELFFKVSVHFLLGESQVASQIDAVGNTLSLEQATALGVKVANAALTAEDSIIGSDDRKGRAGVLNQLKNRVTKLLSDIN